MATSSESLFHHETKVQVEETDIQLQKIKMKLNNKQAKSTKTARNSIDYQQQNTVSSTQFTWKR